MTIEIQEVIQEMEEEIYFLNNPEGGCSMQGRMERNRIADVINYYKERLEGRERED